MWKYSLKSCATVVKLSTVLAVFAVQYAALRAACLKCWTNTKEHSHSDSHKSNVILGFWQSASDRKAAACCKESKSSHIWTDLFSDNNLKLSVIYFWLRVRDEFWSLTRSEALCLWGWQIEFSFTQSVISTSWNDTSTADLYWILWSWGEKLLCCWCCNIFIDIYDEEGVHGWRVATFSILNLS